MLKATNNNDYRPDIPNCVKLKDLEIALTNRGLLKKEYFEYAESNFVNMMEFSTLFELIEKLPENIQRKAIADFPGALAHPKKMDQLMIDVRAQLEFLF